MVSAAVVGRATMAQQTSPWSPQDPRENSLCSYLWILLLLTSPMYLRHKSAQDERGVSERVSAGASHVMDEWKTSGRSRMPQLMVKIVGGKQIKYFIDGIRSPTDHLEATNNPSNRETGADLSRKSPSHDLKLLRAESNMENVLDALKQVPDRRCVTAPCGDRSRSYIHLSHSKQQHPPITEAQAEEAISPDRCLLSCLSEELQDLDQQTFQDMQEGVTSLDPSRSGSVHQAELVYLFLRLKIPVKLSTLDSVFRACRSSSDPQQVRYEAMLQLIQGAIEEHRHGSGEVEFREESVASTDLESASNTTDVNADQRETWLQRFRKMEKALQMCNTKNTGYVDRDQIKRLILNYSLIFDLNLNPLKVSEVTRDTQTEGKVHLASALQKLKELGSP